MKGAKKYFLIALAVIFIDQTSKLLVYATMNEGEYFKVLGDFFKIHYILNPGMAFGLELGASFGKLLLTLFRLVAVVAISYYIIYLVRKKAHTGFIMCVALILGGALGNVIDSTFYGIFLPGNLPENAPMALFHGQVIDMLYIDICHCEMPSWLPFIGGQKYHLWPIFNIADSSIFIAVVIILFRQKGFFAKKQEEKEEQEQEKVENIDTNTNLEANDLSE